jgi:ketosteroid isomerase-like protein
VPTGTACAKPDIQLGMSEENVERVRLWTDASRRGDWAVALSVYAETVVLDQTRMPDGGVYHGRAGVREFFTGWFGMWEKLEIEQEKILDLGENDVLVIHRLTGTGLGSGVTATMEVADLMTLEGGEIVRQVAYPNATEVLASLGLTE